MYNPEVSTGRIACWELVPIKISTAFNKQQGGYFHHIWPGTAPRKCSVIENDNQLKLSLMVNCQEFEFHGTTLVWFHILWEIDPFVPGIVWSSSQLAPPIWDVKQSTPCIATFEVCGTSLPQTGMQTRACIWDESRAVRSIIVFARKVAVFWRKKKYIDNTASDVKYRHYYAQTTSQPGKIFWNYKMSLLHWRRIASLICTTYSAPNHYLNLYAGL